DGEPGRPAGHLGARRPDGKRPAAWPAADRQGVRRGHSAEGGGGGRNGGGFQGQAEQVVDGMSRTIKGQTGEWEIVIGMEVHAQVLSNSKLFSGASTEFGGEPNTQVSFVDAGMPGMLPVINRFCVEQAVKTGLGLKAKINNRSVFDRKNYFFPDLPS